MMNRVSVLVVAAAISLGSSLLAHHSASMFDDSKVVEKKGIVKELQWTNPHVWLQIVVEEKGTKTEWSLEGGSPNTLSRQGWRSTTVKTGDAITVVVHPLRNDEKGGQYISVTLPDGNQLGRRDDGVI